jgi:hypothetical protein
LARLAAHSARSRRIACCISETAVLEHGDIC